MYVKIFLFILSAFSAIENDSNVSDISMNSLQTNSYNSTPIIWKREENRFNFVILVLYMLCIGILVVIYYVKTNRFTDIQQFLVLLGSGLSNVLTGVLLFEVKHSTGFKQINGLLILIQPLMGLKGNLEMTMASRMSTLMNLREDMVSFQVVCKEILDDIILVQSQATVVSLVTVLFTILGLVLESFESINGNNIINLCAISLLTANFACFILDHDPDDLATPVAASLGDFVTLLTMVGVVYLVTHFRSPAEFPIESFIVIVMVLIIEPILIALSYNNPKTRPVLIYGWSPIIVASIISTFSGIIFTHSNDRYQKLAIFQPLFNGFAGNCLALLASRISTSLHRLGPLGTTNENLPTFVSPYYAFKSKYNRSARTTTILLIIVIPSQFLYILLISVIQESSKFKLTLPFVIIYLTFSLLQIALLLYFAYNLTHWIWKLGYDPDMNAIPILTSLADLTGTLILFFTYYLLEILQDINALESEL